MNPQKTRRWTSRFGVFCLVIAGIGLNAGAATAALTPLCDGKAATVIGTDGEDVLRGTSEPDVIVGLGGDDVIRGLSGSDSICGGAGADEIQGHAGPRDRLFGEGDDDLIVGGSDLDLIVGGSGDDTVSGGVGRDELFGGAGNDTVAANRFAPSTAGDAGPNELSGGTGNDFLYGATCTEPPADEVGCSRYESSVYVGGSGDDRMIGGDSPDVFRPGTGADEVAGRGEFDVVSYYPTVGSSDAGVLVDLQDGVARSERGRDRLNGIDGADGTKFDDELFGNGDRNLLRGFEGDDRLSGRGGNDRNRQKQITGLDGGLGRDTILGGRGSDVLADDYHEGDGRARMFGGDGNDVLSLLHPRQHSSVSGGDGSDTFMAVGGDDESPAVGVLLDLGMGYANDRDGSWRMPVTGIENAITGAGEDTINGSHGPNVLYGGPRADLIWGGDGDDVIWGGDGADLVNGRTGHDVCYVDPEDDGFHCEEWISGAPTTYPI